MKDYLNEINRREVQITRFATYLLSEYAYPNLKDAQKSARLILLDAEDITSKTKLSKVERDIIKAIKKPFTDIMASIELEMQTFAIEEAVNSAKLLQNASGVTVAAPQDKAVIAAVTNNFMTLETATTAVSSPFSGFVKTNIDNTLNNIIAQIRAGFGSNETVKQMIARVQAVTNGMLKTHIETLVRTGVSFYAQQGRNAMRDENMDIIKREVPVVTFDNRTSITCMSISDRYPNGWKVGESPIGYPPYHYNCRTVIIYWTSDEVEWEGTRASVGGKHDEAAYEAAQDGKLEFNTKGDKQYFDPTPIPAKTPFAKFLKTQPYWYIKQQLGKTRAELFISGDKTLAQMTDKDLKPLPLAKIL